MLTRTMDYWIVLGFLTFLSVCMVAVLARQTTIKAEILANRAEYITRSGDRWSRGDHDKWCIAEQNKNPGWKCTVE